MPNSRKQPQPEIKHYKERIEDLETALETALYWYHKPEGELNSDTIREMGLVRQILDRSKQLSAKGM